MQLVANVKLSQRVSKAVCLYELTICKGWPHTLLGALQDLMQRIVSHPHNLPEIAIYNSDGASKTCQQQQGCSSSGVGAPFTYKELFLWLQQKHDVTVIKMIIMARCTSLFCSNQDSHVQCCLWFVLVLCLFYAARLGFACSCNKAM